MSRTFRISCNGRFNITQRSNEFFIEDSETGDDYSLKYDSLHNKYICIDNHDDTIGVWDSFPTHETVIDAIVCWQNSF